MEQMFSASAVPMWIALFALAGTIITPIIQGRVNRNSPVTKADAAEKFTRIAAGVAEDYDELRTELRELKPMLRELIQAIDALTPFCAPDDTAKAHRVHTIVDKLRERLY